MPLIRRMPKRGFNHARHAIRYIGVNLDSLNRFPDGSRIEETDMRKTGLAKGKARGIKILGGGELTRKLTVCARAFSASARRKIEKAGGTCQTVASVTPS